MDLLPFDEYVAQLPRKRMAAGVLLRSVDGRILLVEPSYKPTWDIPGGSVDADEAPWATARRELREELGLDRPMNTVLVIDHEHAANGYPEAMVWVFDGGILDDSEHLHPTDEEIVSVGLYHLDEVSGKLKPALARRLSVAAGVAARGGPLALCDDGVRRTP
ncbi:NUDIX hydrolase [Haloechinothrix salitolerans]|uniref:NUDIX domain-containing protein n=1 Tax=Haloechinothrix salitolerans TaxID=926830 RepID=A0ABW2C630_9PSEU